MTQGQLNSTEPVLTAPLSLDADESNRAPNIMKRILSLLDNMRPGSDLTRLQLSPMFNIPKSQLQCYGESVYCIGSDMLGKCAQEETPLSRFISVVAWSISTLRPLSFGLVPYNPILGETHHVSRGSLNVLIEQVSHHPPVTALQATDEKQNIEMLWCQSPIPKFYGLHFPPQTIMYHFNSNIHASMNSFLCPEFYIILGTHVETEVKGERQLKLLDKNETYRMNSPKLVIGFIPFPRVDWLGNVRIQCQESGFEADLCYRSNTFFPRPSVNRSINGKIFSSSTSQTIYEIYGHWDRTVMVKNVSSGEISVIYNAREALSGLKTPMVNDPRAVSQSESSVVWGEVNKCILERSWDRAREAKSGVEERQRETAMKMKSRGEEWRPKHFKVSQSKEKGWECIPINNPVPSAPIIVLLDEDNSTAVGPSGGNYCPIQQQQLPS